MTRTPLSGTGFGYADDMIIQLQNTLNPETFQYVRQFQRQLATRSLPLEPSEEQIQAEHIQPSETTNLSSTEGEDSNHSSESSE